MAKRHITHPPQGGIGLIELMVAVAIGLVAILVIMQVFSAFEGDKRTSTSAADAQNNAAISLYYIKRQAAMAGFGLPTYGDSQASATLMCSDKNLSYPAAGPNKLNMFPLAIVDGGTGSDMVLIRQGSSPMGGAPIKALSSDLASKVVGVNNSLPCNSGDVVVLNNNMACTTTAVTAVADSTHITLGDVTGVTINQTMIACLGAWTEYRYGVGGGTRLQLTTTVAGGAQTIAPVVSDVVNIQAQYGVSDTEKSNQITAWVNATGAWADPSVADRNRIKAIRVAVVARSGLREKEVVTTACSSTTAANPTGLCAWEGSVASPAPEIDLSGDPNWQYYRYRVLDTVIPLRNVIWAQRTML